VRRVLLDSARQRMGVERVDKLGVFEALEFLLTHVLDFEALAGQ
jgi:hypothetical protein